MSNYKSKIYPYLLKIADRVSLMNYLLRFMQFFAKRPRQKSMNFFADAVHNYWIEDKETKLIAHQNCLYPLKYKVRDSNGDIKIHRFNGRKFEFDISRYFRDFADLDRVEKRLIYLAYGEILDIGCNTGYYMRELSNKGNAIGIDISERLVKIAHDRGVSNCYVADIFKLKTNRKFDTVSLMECDLGIAGSSRRLKKLVKKLYTMLNDNGQILTVMRHIMTLNYWNIVITLEYNGHFGTPFRWVYINIPLFFKVCKRLGFRLTMIEKEIVNEIPLVLVRLIKS